jgi:hypothetical protein
MKQAFMGSGIVYHLARSVINENCSSKKCFIPVLEGHVFMSKKRESHFDNMMFSFCRPVLLMSVWTRNMMSNVKLSKERIKLFILTTPIRLHDKDFPIKETFNKGLKFLKLLKKNI